MNTMSEPFEAHIFGFQFNNSQQFFYLPTMMAYAFFSTYWRNHSIQIQFNLLINIQRTLFTKRPTAPYNQHKLMTSNEKPASRGTIQFDIFNYIEKLQNSPMVRTYFYFQGGAQVNCPRPSLGEAWRLSLDNCGSSDECNIMIGATLFPFVRPAEAVFVF